MAPDDSEADLRFPWSWIRNWDRFWFTPSDPITIGLMRLCAGSLFVYIYLMYTFDLLSYVGPGAWLDNEGGRSASHYLRYEAPINAFGMGWDTQGITVSRGQYFWSIYYHVHDPVSIYAIHFTIVGIMFLFAIGLWSRVTSVLSWMGAMCYLQRAPTLLFGMDTMSNLLLIYLMIAPSGAALSVDSWLRRRRERAAGLGDRPSPPLVTATLATRLIQVNFCIIYLASGTSKLLGPSWWNGTAIWSTVANSYFAPLNQAWYLASMEYIASHRWMWEIAMSAGSIFTLVMEIGFPFLVWNRRLRWWMVGGSVLLHTGIGFFMGLATFSLAMLCLVTAFIPPEAVRELIASIVNAWKQSAVTESPPPSPSSAPLAMSRR